MSAINNQIIMENLLKNLSEILADLRNKRRDLEDAQTQLLRLQSNMYIAMRNSGEKTTEKTIEAALAIHPDVIQYQEHIKMLNHECRELFDERDILRLKLESLIKEQ